MSSEEQRNKIIVAEIQHWKASRLLPEKYCDFLLTLYTKGDGTAYQKIDNPDKHTGSQWGKLLFLLIIIPVILLLYINLNPLLFVFSLLPFAMLVLALYQSVDHFILGHLALIILLLIVLLLTISISHLTGYPYVTNTVILLNFISWFVVGVRKRYTYLIIVSLLAMLFLLFYVVL